MIPQIRVGILYDMPEVKVLLKVLDERLIDLSAKSKATGKSADSYPNETYRLNEQRERLRDLARQLVDMERQNHAAGARQSAPHPATQ